MKHYKHSYAELAKIGRRYYNDTNFSGVGRGGCDL